MSRRSHAGEHRQPWRRVTCPCCRLSVLARPGRPGRPWRIRWHLTDDGEPCGCDETAEVVV